MTAQQLEHIAALRQHNYPYSFIARELSLPLNTVKSICRRRGIIAAGARKTKSEKENPALCKNCRKPLPAGSRTDTVFCSDYCRTAWRRNNRNIEEIKP